jgi:hypothetical protein
MKLSSAWPACAWLGVAVLGLFPAASGAQASGDAFVVYPEYRNELADATNNPAAANSLALFSGNLGLYSAPGSGLAPAVPAGMYGTQSVQLVRSGFGQMQARSVPFPGFVLEIISSAQDRLYPGTNVMARESVAGGGAAFRYKQLLYNNDTSTNGSGKVRVEFETIDTLFTEADRAQTRLAIEELRQALKYAPLHRKLRNAILDAYYDWIVAEMQHVKKDVAELARLRLGLASLPPGEFIVDREIAAYTNILNRYDGILENYGRLFTDNSGINLAELDSAADTNLTLGEYIFRQEQPTRNQMAAQFRDADGVLTTVSTNWVAATNVLFAGYKDYVGLVGVLREYALSAAELAKLYGIRGRQAVQPGQKDDRTLGFELIQQIDEEIGLSTKLLNRLLPDAGLLEDELDASGVRAAVNGLLGSSAALNKVGDFLNGQVNVLGYDPDFLILFNLNDGTFDSYDAIRSWIGTPEATATILGRARKSFEAARNSYDAYRGYADQVSDEMGANEDTYAGRYQEITGYLPGEAPDPIVIPPNRPYWYPAVSATNVPTHINNPRPGSELRQVYLSMEQSDIQQANFSNSLVEVRRQRRAIEDRLRTSEQRRSEINAAAVDYVGVIVTQRNIVTTWNYRQALAQASYDTLSDAASVGIAEAAVGIPVIGVAGIANMAVQTFGEEAKGNAERDLEVAAANYDKELALADFEQNIFQAAEESRNLDREQQTIVLGMQDNAFIKIQDLDREDSLKREIDEAVRLRNENNRDLAGRYYADPIHFLRAQNSMIRADYAFRSAQRWVFFAMRALEYKYNDAFDLAGYKPSSLFKLRNYQELEDFVISMDEFNMNGLSGLGGRTRATDIISLRDDVWGRVLTNAQDRAAEFAKRFAEARNASGSRYELKLNLFNIANAQPTGSRLFRGAVYGTNGTLSAGGFYLDKIDWIKVKFVNGNFTNALPVANIASLIYGGTTYDRPSAPLCYDEGQQRSRELQQFPFRYFKLYPGGSIQTFANQEESLFVAFWNRVDKADEPDDSYKVSFLKERSVAASLFTLVVPFGAWTNSIGSLQDVQIYINHVFAGRDPCVSE